jgi:tetratricopeptide (TPR) repeat protein
MSLFRTLIFFIIFLTSVNTCADEIIQDKVNEVKLSKLLVEGITLLKSKNLNEAVTTFDKIITEYKEAYKNEKQTLYSAHSATESMVYALEAANAGKSAKIVSATYSYAYYLKANALIDLGNIKEAKKMLDRALTLSPHNSLFLSEKGNIYQREKNWTEALKIFQQAESAAQEFSPTETKNNELTLALRGIGYVYVEQGKLDDAEKIYLHCLEINANDFRALSELKYVQGLQAKLNNK